METTSTTPFQAGGSQLERFFEWRSKRQYPASTWRRRRTCFVKRSTASVAMRPNRVLPERGAPPFMRATAHLPTWGLFGHVGSRAASQEAQSMAVSSHCSAAATPESQQRTSFAPISIPHWDTSRTVLLVAKTVA